MISKASFNRLQSLQAAVGANATNAILAFADQIRAAAPDMAELLHDVLVFRWISAGFLNDRRITDLKQDDFLHMLGWYYVARWSENDQAKGSPDDEKHLQTLATSTTQPIPQAGPAYTWLMIAIYYYRRDVSSIHSMNGSYLTNDLLYWFYIHGVQEYRLQRCISSTEIEALDRPLAAYQAGLISILDLWALSRGPSPDNVDLASSAGQVAASQMAMEIRKSDRAFQVFASVPTPAASTEANQSHRLRADFPWLARQIARTGQSHYNVVPGQAEYFGKGLPGSRLLIPGDWHSLDECVVWSKYPASSLLFAPAGPPSHGAKAKAITKIGLSVRSHSEAALLGQIVTVVLNGRFVADIPVSEMLASDVVLIENVAESIVDATTNVLQFLINKPFIPSEHLDSNDARRLGVAFRRVWFG